MKKKSQFPQEILILIIIILAVSCFNFNANRAYPHSLSTKTDLKYFAVLKRLGIYKKNLDFLSLKIYKKKNEIKDLKNKIKNAEDKVKKIKNKIKKDGLLINGLTARIFIIHKEYGSARLLYFKDNADSFIVNYQLKTLLQNEEARLSKLVKRKKKFLKLKKYLKKEKNSLIAAVKSINDAKRELEYLIRGINKYIKSLKIKYKKNKNNRLLRRKVIKLIHKLNEGSKKNDIKFILMR